VGSKCEASIDDERWRKIKFLCFPVGRCFTVAEEGRAVFSDERSNTI